MKRKKFSRDNIIELLIKQANGFYYTEEQYEYEKTQNKSNFIKNNIKNSNILNNFSNNDRGNTQLSMLSDTLELSNEEQTCNVNNPKNLTLVKKKVSTHFISPDMHAIKILLEIFHEKVGDNPIENMTDSELLILKNKLIGELLNEPNKDK